MSKFLSFVPFAAFALIGILGVYVSVGTETGRTAMTLYGQAIVDQGAPVNAPLADRVAAARQ